MVFAHHINDMITSYFETCPSEPMLVHCATELQREYRDELQERFTGLSDWSTDSILFHLTHVVGQGPTRNMTRMNIADTRQVMDVLKTNMMTEHTDVATGTTTVQIDHKTLNDWLKIGKYQSTLIHTDYMLSGRAGATTR